MTGGSELLHAFTTISFQKTKAEEKVHVHDVHGFADSVGHLSLQRRWGLARPHESRRLLPEGCRTRSYLTRSRFRALFSPGSMTSRAVKRLKGVKTGGFT